jgi:hypothetical protein
VPGVADQSSPPSKTPIGDRLKNLSHRQLAIIGVVIVVIIGAVVGIAVSSGGKKNAGGKTTTTNPSTTVVTTPGLAANICPLTDLPAAGGVVPKRPALLVKIGNEPEGARPQSGLNEADIVFDTPAEGFIMRYMAVYQCGNASSIGPIRSVRWVDYHVAREFIQPILAFAGGINPNVDAVASLHWLTGANLLEGAQAAGHRTTNRVAPDNLYTSTTALYGLFSKQTRKPKPIFIYTPALPSSAKPVSSAAINFSSGTDVVWKWQASTHSFIHTYAGATDIDTLTGQPVSTTNIVIQIVHYVLGPYSESTGGSGDVESGTVGTGTGYILRGGHYIPVKWDRKDYVSPTIYTDASGQKVGLAPGRTWVEFVTTTQAENGGIHFTS